MFRRQLLYPIDGKGELEIERLLGPERTVVIESRDPLVR